ncbi:MAG: retroviral-like aspartic protease family protein [Syntrophobacteraceae bacterium]
MNRFLATMALFGALACCAAQQANVRWINVDCPDCNYQRDYAACQYDVGMNLTPTPVPNAGILTRGLAIIDNATKPQRMIDACMAAKGWTPVQVDANQANKAVAPIGCAGWDEAIAAYNRGDYAKAYKELKELAEQGHANAQYELGYMYVMGQGVRQDYDEAVKWFRKAAEQGNAWGQGALGMMYHYGHGVPQDYAEAEKWLRRAAEQGHAEAQTILKSWSTTEIPLEKRGGVYQLPLMVNRVLMLKFILDTGAAEVNIPADVASTLLRTGTITQSDFLPGKSYILADGSEVRSSRFIIRELDIGGIKISQVPASIGSANGSLLLGQSFLGRLGSWSLDNNRHVLMIGSSPAQPK